jgi:hypothetical protein
VRIAAVDSSLAAVADPQAHDTLLRLARQPGLAPGLQGRRRAPRSPATGPPDVPGELPPSQNGAVWLSAGSGASLGYALAAAGWFGRSQRWEVGAVTGAAAGATAGWIYGRAWPREAGDTALVATSGALGTTSGFLLGWGADPGSPSTAVLAGLGGEFAGLGLAGLAAGPAPG